MSQDYNEYLAINVLNDRQSVSFRSLSRALKVHSNLAKQMLYDFHNRQNTKNPGSVHATYLITGTKIQTKPISTSDQDGEDSIMHSDPVFPSSSMPHAEDDMEGIPTRSIMLAREEHLEQAKATFDHVTGIHVYSLQAQGLSDIHTLTECNRRIAASYASEDPLKAWKQYGTIQNAHVRRRTGRTAPPPPPAAPASSTADVKPKAATSSTKTTAAPEKEQQQTPSQSAASQESKPDTAAPARKPATVKRQDSNLFKSFAKASAKPKKPDTDSSAAPTPDPDASMTGFSDDDDDDDPDSGSGLPDAPPPQASSAPGGESRKEREAKLQAMMELEDEPMADAEGEEGGKAGGTSQPDNEDEDEDRDDEAAAAADAGAIDQAAPKPTQPKDAAAAQEQVTVENGRRRGRRRVMKSRTMRDENGYLETREEPAWESFSEDEPAVKKPKIEVAASAAKAGAKKAAAKPGQGNIMSFFSKK